MMVLALGACGTLPKPPASKPSSSAPAKTGGYYLDDGPGENAPANLEAIPDAVPREEPLHRGANRPYTVFGKTYVPNVSNEPFRQQGLASWYGRKFHGNPTSIGEPYDMYGMTAAHPTLPLPSYVRVTNPANMKSVVVRVNDRGPFHSDRIIDLSFTAAAKLDLARRGSGVVIVERVFAGAPMPPMPTAVATLPPQPPPTNIAVSPITPDAMGFYLQLGAFSSRDNAENFRVRMARELDWNKEPIQLVHSEPWFRVRMGPYSTRAEAEAIAAEVKRSHDFSPAIQKQ
jgi:rare lipoprotein A